MSKGQESGYPALLRMRPHVVVSNVGVALGVAWAGVWLIDILDVYERETPLWLNLFNDAPVEWTQWFLLGLTIAASGYLSAWLRRDARQAPSSFYLLIAVGTALMLIEEAGDIRHSLRLVAGAEPAVAFAGWRTSMLIEGPYFALLAAIPLYALVRYGRPIWASRRTRPYLIAGFGLYGLAAGASTLRMVGENYATLGSWIDRTLLGGRWPIPDDRTQEWGHYFLVDSAIEESVELMAAACFLAMVLAFAHEHEREQLSATSTGKS